MDGINLRYHPLHERSKISFFKTNLLVYSPFPFLSLFLSVVTAPPSASICTALIRLLYTSSFFLQCHKLLKKSLVRGRFHWITMTMKATGHIQTGRRASITADNEIKKKKKRNSNKVLIFLSCKITLPSPFNKLHFGVKWNQGLWFFFFFYVHISAFVDHNIFLEN